MSRFTGKKVFICSPFRPQGETREEREKDWNRNVERAQRACKYAVDNGYLSYAPHLYFPQFLSDGNPDERKAGLLMGLTWLVRCDELWVIGYRISEGMKQEIEKAEELGIKVKHYVSQRTPEERLLDTIFRPEINFCEMT